MTLLLESIVWIVYLEIKLEAIGQMNKSGGVLKIAQSLIIWDWGRPNLPLAIHVYACCDKY